jgi:hypothetical protein
MGLVCLVASATGALGAPAVSAHTFNYEIDHTGLMAEAKSEQILTTGAGELKCKKISLSASDPLNTKLLGVGSTTDQTSLTFRPTHTECNANISNLGIVKATVEFTSCYIEITGETTSETEHAPLHIGCNPGDEIHIKVTAVNVKCYTIPAQTVEGLHYENTGVGSARDINISATAIGLDITKEGACGSGLEEFATYQGELTLTGTDTNENQVGIWTTP